MVIPAKHPIRVTKSRFGRIAAVARNARLHFRRDFGARQPIGQNFGRTCTPGFCFMRIRIKEALASAACWHG